MKAMQKQSLPSDQLYVQRISVDDDLPQQSYVANLPVVRSIVQSNGLALTAPVTIFVGENGIGKSTLIEAIALAMKLNPEGGSANFNFSTRATHSPLGDHLRLLKGGKPPRDSFFLRTESFYNVATNIDDLGVIKNYGGTSLHEQSHGESFMSLIENRFRGRGLYILDEPEAALSPMSIMQLMYRIKMLIERESQFIVSTHSPLLMAYPHADVVQIRSDGIEHVDYRDTEHFQIMSRFFENPERMLAHLFDD